MDTKTIILIIVSVGCAIGGLTLLCVGKITIAGILFAIACIFSGLSYNSLKKKK